MISSKKAINLGLICLVIALWGTVLYKYINRFFISEGNFVSQTEYYSDLSSKIVKKDTFKLLKLKRDPFLNKNFVSQKNIVQPQKEFNKPRKLSVSNSNSVVDFPSIKYYGYIKSKSKNEELVLLKINNRLERVKVNSSINGLVVKNIYKDSIEISYNKQNRIYFKN